jgi:hypothetical protein
VRIESAFSAFDIADVLPGGPLTGANSAGKAKPFRTANHAAFDQQTFFTVGIHLELWRAVTELRVQILHPKIRRLQYVSIGIDDVVRSAHNRPPFLLNVFSLLSVLPSCIHGDKFR